MARTFAEIYRDRKKHPEPFKIEDFMPSEGESKRPRKLALEEMAERVKAIHAALGGKENK